jgi:segregation and condensation protein A
MATDAPPPRQDPATTPPEPASAPREVGGPHQGFAVHLDNFEGPFDLLLSLIAKHKLDVTEVALSQVTDEFIAFIRAAGGEWDLGQATEFLLVAATLLDLKAARLLPSGVVEDEEDLALLEARDLLFARLLQYRAYKEAAAWIAGRMAGEGRFFPRAVSLEPQFAAAVPEVLLGIGAEQFAIIAARAMQPRVAPSVAVDHVHAPRVSVREQAAILAERLADAGAASFRALISDCTETVEVVARFLALLELYREGQVAFDQVTALGDLHVRWTGGSTPLPVVVSDEYDGSADAADDSDSDAEDGDTNETESPAADVVEDDTADGEGGPPQALADAVVGEVAPSEDVRADQPVGDQARMEEENG